MVGSDNRKPRRDVLETFGSENNDFGEVLSEPEG